MKGFLRNLAILVGMILIVFILFPGIVKQIAELYSGLGILPFVLLAILITALPRKSRKKRG